jgi:hypothetical protein
MLAQIGRADPSDACPLSEGKADMPLTPRDVRSVVDIQFHSGRL